MDFSSSFEQATALAMIPMMALGIPIVALMIPIVAILTAHQRKMAETFRQGSADHGQLGQIYAEIDNLRSEVAQLKERHNDTLLALEDLRGPRTHTPPAFEQARTETENA